MTLEPDIGGVDALVQPLDEPNRQLLQQVHPEGWRNPEGQGVYDLVVIGGGTAGLVSAAGAAGLGARVALVERALLGGDCLNTGCVPSKALLRSARAVGELKRADTLGIRAFGVDVDFARVMTRMRRRRAEISLHDSAARFTGLGIDVFYGSAAFTGPRTIAVDARELRFRRAVVASGGRATAPPVPGLADAGYLTNDTLFWLTELPRRLLIIGAGPIGCEMAQAFSRFGSHVTVLDQAPQVLPREDPDAAALVQRALEADGVTLEVGIRLQQVRREPDAVTITFDRAGVEHRVTGDQLLVAAGRAPNIERLNLPSAGIAFDKSGVTVNDRLQTTNPRVFAAGDVCSVYKFTHAADAMARIVIQNALFYGRKRMSALKVPWCTYTDPEIAHVGLYEKEARAAGCRVDTITIPFSDVDRAIVDEEQDGFVRVHHEAGKLLGCTIVGSHAGEMIAEAAYCLTGRGTLGQLAATIHPYPTRSEALKKAGDAYRRTLLTPRLRRWCERYFRVTRR